MKIDCISDLHGFYPELQGGDLLIIAGDLTKRDEKKEYVEFFHWLDAQDYEEIVLIAGNHDNIIQKESEVFKELSSVGVKYLQDSGTEFEGLKIWGSPWTLTFPGMNPHCKAFTVDYDKELMDKWDLISEDTDVLITHMPPYGIQDWIGTGKAKRYCGSLSLRDRISNNSFKNLKLIIFGHIHEHGGTVIHRQIITVNASIMNEFYEPVNKPVRIEL